MSDEQIVHALITTTSKKAAAEACGISPRQLRNRMKRPGLREKYDRARKDFVLDALAYMQGNMTAAAETIAEVMGDAGNSAQVRINAATALINGALRISSEVDLTQRLDAIEAQINSDRETYGGGA